MKRAQRGATMIEFALVLLMFLIFMLGVIDFSRMLFTWNAATEATRAGARYAVVCDSTSNSADVLLKMQEWLPQIQTISVDWSPAGCTSSTCESVTVSITGLNFVYLAPLPSSMTRLIPMPAFSTYLMREVMRQDAHSSEMCSS
jgi:Flp pilus assembly protein TadG